jgi:membrane protease subunit HflK
VNSDELGVVVRFGEYHRTTNPGLNYHLPFPIEQVIIPSVTSINKVEVGDRNVSENPGVRRSKLAAADKAANANTEGHMLTADRNIVDIGFEVQWKIDAGAPEKYLFNLRNPDESIRNVAESAMREVIGRNNLSDILTIAQSKIAEDTRAIMQTVFDAYGAGIEVIAVNLSRPDVPQPVIDEFQDVKRAEQDKQTAESVAEGYRNDIIPRAKGEASKMIQDAEAYKSQVISGAQGDASRFKQIYNEYVGAKDVTRKRMYLETMETIFKGMPKIMVQSKGNSVQVLPVPAPRNAPAASTPVMPIVTDQAAGVTQ